MKTISTTEYGNVSGAHTRTGLLAGGLLAASLLTGAAHAAPADALFSADAVVARQMAATPHSGWSSVIVKTDGTLTPAQETRLTALGADITRRLPFIQSVAVRVPVRNLAKLAALPFVTHLSADMSVKKTDEFTVAESGAAVAWAAPYSVGGQGVTVAVVDSGIAIRPDLTDNLRLRGTMDYTVNGYTFMPNMGSDACGHGTHVAGIIAGSGAQSTGSGYTHTYYGIAPKASILSVRVLDGQGQGTVSTVLAGLQWVVANKARYNIKVVNLSLGHPVGESYTTDPLCQAVEAAWKAGIVVVCAAGNDGRALSVPIPGMDNEGYGTNYGSVNSPANDPYVITVGAMKAGPTAGRANDRIATYSGRGPSRLDTILKPDIVAPGNQVISTLSPNSTLANAYSGTNLIPLASYAKVGNSTVASYSYFRLSGTSMAAPVVAGAAALLLQKDPSLTPDTVKARLMLSADKWAAPGGQFDPCTYGAGYLDIPAALQSTVTMTAPAFSPPLSRDAQGNVGVDATNVIWGKNVVWGKNVLWGTTTTGALNVVWGKNILLGTSAIASSNVVWGKSVWTNNVVWGANSSAVDLSSVAVNGEK